MTFLLNKLGTVKRFNGIDVQQTRHFNHISCQTYIEKICKYHEWTNLQTHNVPTPMQSDPEYLAIIQLTQGPETLNDQQKLQKQMEFNYQQAIGELIYAHTVCQVDISVAIITLSQHSNNPAQIHYEAVKTLFAYLYATKEQGLTYWRPKPREDLPLRPNLTPISKYGQLEKFDNHWNALHLSRACDSTWGSD